MFIETISDPKYQLTFDQLELHALARVMALIDAGRLSEIAQGDINLCEHIHQIFVEKGI